MSALRICMIGHGMMGGWHSSSLQSDIGQRELVVGRRKDATRGFAREWGYRRWSVDWHAAVTDPDVDVVVVAGPSQTHAEITRAALEADKHVLVEIPLALTLADCEALVALAAEKNLMLGVVHPIRFRSDLCELVERLQRGEETLRHVQGRFFLRRLSDVGSTGYRRSWVDNLLWHHFAHLIDAGLWLLGSGDTESATQQLTSSWSCLMEPDANTGQSMDATIALSAGKGRTLVATGSYYSTQRVFDIFVVTDRESYRIDIFGGTLTRGSGVIETDAEKAVAMRVLPDFIEAVRTGRPCLVPATSVLPAMRLIDAANTPTHCHRIW